MTHCALFFLLKGAASEGYKSLQIFHGDPASPPHTVTWFSWL
jgi:hypothetical protein